MGSAMTSPAEVDTRRRALVVGTGLIGGSIALGLRRRGWHVSGLDADEEQVRAALEAGVVDAVGDDPMAEVVFVAVPAAAVAGVVRGLVSGHGRLADAVVTDVSGVKTAIVEEADHPRFIGGHPMAGSEQAGLHGADPDLFEGAVWVLTPTAATDLEAFNRLKGVVLSLGADVLVLSAADHDRLVAVVSHVPHLVAATLMNAATDGAEQDGALLRLAAGGFRDMTRVAAGQPGIWLDICADNAAAIVAALDALVTDLGVMRERVAAHDPAGLLASLEKASAARRNLPARAVRPDHLAELRIPVPDRVGVLAEIMSLAADAGIGIYDIEIAHSAEGPRGVLILVVDGADADALAVSVESRGYRCRAEHLS
jgi:prephenate dehydrogenase